jgi:polyisoprenoid-binding protein YceI
MSATAATPATTTTWNVDPVHSTAEFRVRHMMISNVRGQFTGVSGKLSLDPGDIAKSQVEASIDVTTIDTRDPQRDTHLKSPDFFDAEKFPAMSFRSSRVVRKGDGAISVSGPLTIHGTTKEVEFEVEGPTPAVKDPWGNTRIGLTAKTKVDRREYGLNFNAALETGGVLVGEDVHITLELEFVQAA